MLAQLIPLANVLSIEILLPDEVFVLCNFCEHLTLGLFSVEVLYSCILLEVGYRRVSLEHEAVLLTGCGDVGPVTCNFEIIPSF